MWRKSCLHMENDEDCLELEDKKVTRRYEMYSLMALLGVPTFLGAITVLGAVMNEKNTLEHLAKNAVPIVKFERGVKNYWSFNQYEDVNQDGFYEHTAEIINPKTGELEKRLVEFNGKQIVLRPYRVEDKIIVYLD